MSDNAVSFKAIILILPSCNRDFVSKVNFAFAQCVLSEIYDWLKFLVFSSDRNIKKQRKSSLKGFFNFLCVGGGNEMSAF